MVKVMIHATSKRMLYVQGFLLKRLMMSGFNSNDIYIFDDKNNHGCLTNYLESFALIDQEFPIGCDVWHLQDDVVISPKFWTYCKAFEGDFPNTVIAAFQAESGSERRRYSRGHRVYDFEDMFYSFPCIRIPFDCHRMFIHWMRVVGNVELEYAVKAQHNKHVDYLFMKFMEDLMANGKDQYYWLNVDECLVEHIDNYLGGSTIGTVRPKPVKAFKCRRDVYKWVEDAKVFCQEHGYYI